MILIRFVILHYNLYNCLPDIFLSLGLRSLQLPVGTYLRCIQIKFVVRTLAVLRLPVINAHSWTERRHWLSVCKNNDNTH